MKQKIQEENYVLYNNKSLQKYLNSLFSKMGIGLFFTFIISYLLGNFFPKITLKIFNSPICFILIISQIIVIFMLNNKIKNNNKNGVNILYYTYTILNGFCLSWIYLILNSSEIITALFSTCLFFSTMALYGHITKNDLSKWSSILFVGLISIFILSLFNIIGSFFGFHFMFFEFLISFLGIIFFSLFVAYDMQRIREFYFSHLGNSDMENIISTMGAFNLYSNFINIFYYIVRIILLTREKK